MTVLIPSPPRIVIDTNTVLDWLVFCDPRIEPIQTAVTAGEVRWVATSAMRGELAHVLARHRFARWAPDLRALWSRWDEACTEVPEAAAVPNPRLRCTDPDDQKFIDLAVASGARWLVTRDRAVLKLARRLREIGVEVVAPDAWLPPDSPPG